MNLLKGKTAVITGAARGIGKAIAMRLAENGANIVINDIPQSEELDKTCAEISRSGVEAIGVKGDVRNIDDMNTLVNTAVEKFGILDIFVNNAGITRDGLMLRMSEEDWDSVLSINLKGVFNGTKAAIKPMMRQRSGSIINMASIAGVIGNAGQANYSASKAGIIGLTKTTARELSLRNIRCNAVAPGLIKSPMTDLLSEKIKEEYLKTIPLQRFGTPEQIADTVLFLASDLSSYITGQVINVDGGLVM